MLFDRLLKKRRPAVAKATSQEILADLACTHADSAVRLDAVRRLASLPRLREVLVTDGDVSVREIALARYRNLLCGTDDGGVSLQERLAEITHTENPRVLEHLATEGREPEIRRAAIERVDNTAVLVGCVLHDSLAANRGAALGRIQDRQSLEQIARRIGKKDKAVYREARERLRRLAELEEAPRRVRAQCADLCERVERLGHLEHWSQDRALLEHLDQQWAEIQTQAEPAWRTRYEAARERFLAAYEAHRQANAAQIAAEEARAALRAARESLLADTESALALENERELAAEHARLTAAWQAQGSLPEAEQRALDLRHARALDVLDAKLKDLADQRKRAQQLKKAVSKSERLLAESRPLENARVLDLISQGRALTQSLPASTAGESFNDLAQRLEARLKTQRKHAEQRLGQLPERLEELESALDSGELKRADPLYQSIQAGLELVQSSGLSGHAVDEILRRLRVLAPHLKDLQHWRRWGADQHRAALCEAMEALLVQDLPLPAVAERLHVLQVDWKELDQSGSPANQALWERFHAASDAVYARCRPVLEAEASEREADRAARETICQQLESFLERVDWERVDWKRVMQAERETRQAWSGIGPCEARHRRALERRFHKALKGLDQRLEDERGRNQAFKRGLIERVRALADPPDLDQAIEEIKSLQREWHTTVPARQRDENRLWSEFRSACDLVFERRAAIHQAHRAELDENLAARQALCDDALALAASETDSRRLAAAQRELEQRWRDSESLTVPRQAAGPLAQRWKDARERLIAQRRERQAAERRGALDLLARQAELCERVEHQILRDGESAQTLDAQEAQRAWSELPELEDHALQQAMAGRLRAAIDAAGDPQRLEALRERLAANAERRRRLCLEIEIAAGVSSPPELARQRLELQVSRLAERMVEGEVDSLRDLKDLLGEWYRCGPAPDDPELRSRLEQVRANLGAEPRAETQRVQP
ncbi:MAG: DUF349 domain-containing protein [Chromatiaceae bacterium]